MAAKVKGPSRFLAPLLGLLAGVWPAAGSTAEPVAPTPIGLACAPEALSVAFGDRVRLRAFATPPLGQTVTFRWTSEEGTLGGDSAEMIWAPASRKEGYQKARVEARSSSGAVAECSLSIYLWEGVKGAGDLRLRDLLVCQEGEAVGYGAYSYLLFASEPAAEGRERYLAALRSYLRRTRDRREFESERELGSLNVTHLPIRERPPAGLDLEPLAVWLLDHYDYSCALRLLAKLPGQHPGGPYLVSVPGSRGSTAGSEVKPWLTHAPALTPAQAAELVDQDLTAVPAELVDLWVSEFLLQMAQENFWEEPALRRVVLKMRTVLEVIGGVLPEIRQKALEWIRIGEPSAKSG